MTRIYDWSFASLPSAATVDQAPRHFAWRREGKPGKAAWFTDACLGDALKVDAEIKVAWLIEPRALRTDHYDFVEEHYDIFTNVLSYSREWNKTFHGDMLPYRPGGTRIRRIDRTVYAGKPDLVSIVASEKRGMEGHKLRHDLIAVCPGLDAWGTNYRYLGPYKLPALKTYMYTVVIQSCRADYFFTEALIDAFVTGTIPIYWGCPSIGTFFNPDGMIQCETLDDILKAVASASRDDYKKRLDAIKDNYERALGYVCPEDWMYEQYPYLFD